MANYSLKMARSGGLPCFPTQSVALGDILKMDGYYFRFQQKLDDDQIML